MSVLQRFCASINEEIMQEGSPSTISKQSQLLLLIHSASSKATHLWCHTWKFYVRTEELPSCRPYVLPGLAAIVNCLHEKAWVYTMVVGHWQEWWISSVVILSLFFSELQWSMKRKSELPTNVSPSSKVPFTSWHRDEIGRLEVEKTFNLPYNLVLITDYVV